MQKTSTPPNTAFESLAAEDRVIFSKRLAPHRLFQMTWLDLLKLFMVISLWVSLFYLVPNALYDPITRNAILVIGIIGIWRYGWFAVNFVRSLYYGKVRFPQMRAKADALWQSGWRPSHVHIMMTTYYEKKDVTEKYLRHLVREIERDDLSATIWVGYGAMYDKEIISEFFRHIHNDKLKVVMVKQNQSGKRVAIALCLRAMSRANISRDDIVFFMDGDSIMDQGTIQKCASILGAYPGYRALTTDEDAVVEGPKWVQQWLTMRFAQRRLWMQSHALSHKVLTLTGRMSVYRAKEVLDKDFIRLLESDHLEHWLWGQFRFLSGDDKSTWYALLRKGANMTYVPDAMVYTIEYIEGNGVKRMKENLLRWSGNMLRNGTRALALGPKKVTPFIWMCILDQRISIWTILFGITATLSITTFHDPSFIVTYALWISFTRFLIAISLYCYSERISLTYPIILYVNQLLSAIIKVYMLFRLPKQRWANRQNQMGGQDAMADLFKQRMALFVNIFYITLMLFVVLMLTGIMTWPDWYQFRALL